VPRIGLQHVLVNGAAATAAPRLARLERRAGNLDKS
jgi:hypothetical protein